jgi:hypothetical protein
VRINPGDHEAWLACAQVHFLKRNVGEAINTLRQSYMHIDENPTLHYRMAAYHVYRDELDSASVHFEKGLKLNYYEYHDMFSLFPKTRKFGIFYALIDKHQSVENHNMKL